MKILLCHNFYQQPGGEDRVFADETSLLKSHGHDVRTFTVHNDEIESRSKLAVAGQTVWNRQFARQISELVRRERFDVVHFHNTFPLMSPAVWGAARAAGAATVQTLHNFRLICPKATLQRNGRVCTECVGRTIAAPAIIHRCYRDSLAASTVVSGMSAFNRLRGTYRQDVDRYIALTHMAAGWFARGGLPADRISVKPNFVTGDPAVGDGSGGYALYVGRLSAEKGIDILAAAWRRPDVNLPLVIAGDGPLASQVQALAAERTNVKWLGAVPSTQVESLMQSAACLVMPSIWFEGFPKTLVEGFSVGTPVIASRLGAFEELIGHGRTGLLFEAGNATALAEQAIRVQSDPAMLAPLRTAARQEFDLHYTAERNHEQLLEIYLQAVESRAALGSNKPAPVSLGEV
ncbi:MAG: glycosyltransferase [Pirellulales bacterium]